MNRKGRRRKQAASRRSQPVDLDQLRKAAVDEVDKLRLGGSDGTAAQQAHMRETVEAFAAETVDRVAADPAGIAQKATQAETSLPDFAQIAADLRAAANTLSRLGCDPEAVAELRRFAGRAAELVATRSEIAVGAALDLIDPSSSTRDLVAAACSFQSILVMARDEIANLHAADAT